MSCPSRILIFLCTLLLLSTEGYSGGTTEAVKKWRNTAGVLHPDDPENLINQGKSPKAEYRDDELLVKFKQGVTTGAQQALHAKHGGEKLKEFKKLRIHKIRIPKGESVTDVIRRYRGNSDVEYAEPNFKVHALATPNDLRFSELWGMRNTGQTGGVSGADINATAAWDISTGDSSVIVAVLDSGINYTHTDLAANIWKNPLEIAGNGIDDDNNGYIDDIYGIDTLNHNSNPTDEDGHGTHVSGIIGATGNNGTGVTGVNWNVKILACKFLGVDGGYMDGAIECLDYIKDLKDKGSNIVAVNHSWGCSGGGWEGSCYSQALYDALNAQQDILQIAAAGNDTKNNDANEYYPANYNLPHLISVAATDHNDQPAWFTNFGRQSVHVSAPGDNILSTIPGGYGVYFGSSMAAPHVTGLAALLKAGDPDRTWIELRNLILTTGDTRDALAGVTITGKRINAFKAMTCAAESSITPLKYPLALTANTPVIFSVLSTECGTPKGSVTMTTSGNQTFTLLDNGLGDDKAANDGIFTLSWTPASSNPEKLTFSSPTSSRVIVVPEFSIASNTLSPGTENKPYAVTLTAAGGLAPYTWTIASGSLPPGLTLDSSTGIISGTPTSIGEYSFTVQAAEGLGTSTTKAVYLFIAASDYSLTWSKVYYSEGGFDFANDIKTDRFGDIFVTGYNDGAMLTGKYDRNGDLLWSKRMAGGQGKGIAVDEGGNAYTTGYLDIFSPVGNSQNILTKKFSPDGSEIWSRQKNYYAWADSYGLGVAVNGDGDIFVAGSSEESYTAFDCAAVKYDNSGNQIWAKLRHTGKCLGAATDGTGAVYLVGFTGSMGSSDFLTIKYDTLTGEPVWTRTLNNGPDNHAYRVAVDNGGNAYVTGESTGTSGKTHCVTFKYDSVGNLVWKKDFPGGDYCRGIALDDNGRVYVTGRLTNGYVAGIPVQNYDLFFNIYDADGSLVGAKTFDYSVDAGYGIAVDRAGENIYIAGYTLPAIDLTVPNSAGTKYDYLLLRYTVDKFHINQPELLPVAEVGLPYSKTLSVNGGTAPYHWAVTGGTVPPGLSLNQGTGELAGTPLSYGRFEFTISATDSGSLTAGKTLKITVMELPPSLAGGIVGSPYNQAITVNGAYGPLRWEIASGALPAGLTLAGETGAISGTPSLHGNFPFTIRVTDRDGYRLFKSYQIGIFGISTAALANGTVGQPYTQALSSSGGASPLTWSMSAAELSGLSLDPLNGIISGTPIARGAFPVTLTVRDFQGLITQKAFTLTIHDALNIETATQATGTVGYNLTTRLTATGGTPPYNWSLNTSSLPPGISFYPQTSVLYGMPSSAGLYPVTLTLTDSAGAIASKTVSINIGRLNLTSPSLPMGFLNTEYSQLVPTAGGTAPMTWNIIAGSMPEGLTLNSTTGGISGVASRTGRSVFTLQVADSQSNVSTREYFIEIGRAIANVTAGIDGITPDQSGGTIYLGGIKSGCIGGQSFQTTIATFAYDNNGNNLWETTGACSTIQNAAKVSITADGAVLGMGIAKNNTNTVLIKSIDSGTIPWLREFNLDNGYCGANVTRTMTQTTSDASGNIFMVGQIQCTGSIAGGVFLTAKATPDGTLLWKKSLTRNYQVTAAGIAVDQTGNAVISGTGGANEVLTVKYSTDGDISWSRSYGNDTAAPVRETYGPVIDSYGNIYVAANVRNYSYDYADQYIILKYDNGGNLLWTKSGPGAESSQGIGLDNQGNLYITGNDGKLSFYSTDGAFLRSKTYPPSATYRRVTTAINAEGRIYIAGTLFTASAMLANIDPFQIKESEITFARGVAAVYAFKANGGTLPYSWTISAGQLPAGLSLESSTGLITGVPQENSTSTLTLDAQDADGNHATKVISLVVDDLLLAGATLPPGTIGEAYAFNLVASGSATPFTWQINSGTLPSGLSLDAASGVIQGTPTATGSQTISVQVTDGAGLSRTGSFSIAVQQPVAISTTSMPGITLPSFAADYFYVKLLAEGGVPPYKWSVSTGTLPAGITLDPFTGEIYGKLSTIGNHQFTMQIKDHDGRLATHSYELSIFTINATNSSSGVVGSPFTMTLTATGGRAPYFWKASSGNLPLGLNLNGDTGQITGTPQVLGSATVTIELTDAGGSRTIKYFDFSIAPISCQPGSITCDTCSFASDLFSTLYLSGYARDNSVFKMQAKSYTGGLDFNRNLAVTLRGGYNCSFTPMEYYTEINGTLTVSSGSVSVANIIIR